jgi:MoxR-like ATPase
VEAQVQLSTAMRQLLVALDQADADDPEAHEASADARLLLARAIGDIQAVLGELADLNDQLRAR